MGLIQNTITATIANGESLSAAFFVGEKVLCGVQMPAAWTAADLTFQVSDDLGATWVDLHDDQGNEVTITGPAAGERRSLDPPTFATAMLFKVRSGASAAPVNQAAARSIVFAARKFYSER